MRLLTISYVPHPGPLPATRYIINHIIQCHQQQHRAQELRESGGGRPGLSVLMSLTVSVDVKQH